MSCDLANYEGDNGVNVDSLFVEPNVIFMEQKNEVKMQFGCLLNRYLLDFLKNLINWSALHYKI